MAYKSLYNFIEQIEQKGELLRVKEYANPELEIPEITDRMSKQPNGGKALLFENTGTDFPVLTNALGSDSRMTAALKVNDYDEIAEEIIELLKTVSAPKNSLSEKLRLLPELGKIASYMPKKKRGKGKCQEVIMPDADLTKLPVLKTWSRDGGPFITFPQVITKDPETGIRNVGMYRMQVFGDKLTGMHWHKHKTGERHYQEYKKRGEKMPVAVALGGDPALTYAATAPLPDNIDEYMLAGFLRKQKVKLVKAISQDIYVPACADIIIEGYVNPDEEKIWEGPFGDHTGFFSLADWYPKFHVTTITHRKGAVYPATLVGIPPMEDAYIAKATERIFLAPIQLTMLPEMQDMNLPVAGVAHNISISSIHKEFPGQALKAMNALWGAGQMMFNKIQIICDADVDVHNYEEVARKLSENCCPKTDIQFLRGPLDILDHSASNFAYGSKIGFDASRKLPEERQDASEGVDLTKIEIDTAKIKAQFPEIDDINANLPKKGISAVFISIKKDRKNHVKEISQKLFNEKAFRKIKFLCFLDAPVDVSDIDLSVWLLAGNLEPLRDCYISDSEKNGEPAQVSLDGTRKRADLDNFKRDWPDIVTADEATIKLVDEKWEKYNIGKFISSPSLRYKALALSKTAIVE